MRPGEGKTMGLFGKKKPEEEILAQGRELFEGGDRKKAFLTLHGLATRGNPEACYYIGRYYLEEKQKRDLAESFLEKAAKAGHAGAAEILARQFGGPAPVGGNAASAGGNAVSAGGNPASAGENAAAGHPAAQSTASDEETEALLKQAMSANEAGDYDTSVRIWRELAEKGNAQAQNCLAVSYAKGEGVEKDLKTAVLWYRRAAEQGYTKAMFNLGGVMKRDNGIGPDLAEAVRWYRKAAELGHPRSAAYLGLAYDNGEGVKKDEAEAVRWYQIAVDRGDSAGMRYLGVSYEEGTGVKQDLAKAFSLYCQAADLGDLPSMYYAGMNCENGMGTEQSPEEAASWYRRAAERGEERSAAALGRLYLEGTGVEADLDQALYWAQKAKDGGAKTADELLELIRARKEKEAKRQVEEEAKRQAEEEAKRQAEEAKRQAEEEAKRQAEEEAKRQAEEEAKRQAEEEAKRKAEEETKRRAEEEAKRRAEEEAKKAAQKPEQEAAAPAAETLSSEEAYAEGMKQFQAGNYAAAYPLLKRACPFIGPRKGRYPDGQAALGSMEERGLGTEADEMMALWRYRIAAREGNPDGAEGIMRLLAGKDKATPEDCRMVLAHLNEGNLSGAQAAKETKEAKAAWEKELAQAEERERLKKLELTDNNVYEIYKECQQTDETPKEKQWAGYDIRKLEENKDRILFLMGQLACVHQKTEKPVPIDEKLCEDYRGKTWSTGGNNPVRLLNMGIGVDAVSLQKEGDDERAVFGYSVKKTRSPQDPEFALWYLIWQGEKEAISGNYQEAYRLYSQAAAAGYPAGWYEVGHYYSAERLCEAVGIQKDDEIAYQWYKKAADQGYAPAQRALGTIFQDGIGRKADYEQALFWFQKAADQGAAGAADACEKTRNLMKAQKGDREAQYQAGLFYLKRWDSTALASLPWFEKAAAQKHRDAVFYCGLLYGLLLDSQRQDQEKALRCFREAERLGHTLAGKIAKEMRPGGLFKKEKKTCEQAMSRLLYDYGEEKDTLTHEDMRMLIDLFTILPRSLRSEMSGAQAKRLRALAARL